MKAMFHATWTTRRESIEASGLECGRRRNWASRTSDRIGERDAVYLIDGFDHAVRWAARMAYDHGREAVIAAVDVEGIEDGMEADGHFESGLNGNSFRIHRGPIAAGRVVGFCPVTREMVRAVVAGAPMEAGDHFPALSVESYGPR